MTAEIAILNKSAVALATDSAVTISAGNQAQKVFDSADKLFELSIRQPIGIMIYNGSQFLGMPLESIVKEFRRADARFGGVEDAAKAFLNHLYTLVDSAPDDVIAANITAVVEPIILEIDSNIKERAIEELRNIKRTEADGGPDINKILDKIANEALRIFEEIVGRLGDADFLKRPAAKGALKRDRDTIRSAVQSIVPNIPPEYHGRIAKICEAVIRSGRMSQSSIGFVFAGFGEQERFPTLVSYEVDGTFAGKIKYLLTEHCDIDRRGVRAFVRPFAQKEMVDRFLYGLDDELSKQITDFCKSTIGKISSEIFNRLQFEDDGAREALLENSRAAEAAFLRNLKEAAFKALREGSRAEIEAMVEFMPKPELAKMAEALIDLTSIKRKVSRGLETVGGPVDVAVISKGEGFVWVKRKHYFPREINARYFERLRQP